MKILLSRQIISVHVKLFIIFLKLRAEQWPNFELTVGLTIEWRLTGRDFLTVDISPTFLNTGTTDETFRQSGKQDSFRHFHLRVQPVCKKVQCQSSFATGMQSAPDAFDESKFVMTFLTILGVTEILCSFRLVLDGKTFKEIPELSRLEFIKKFYQLQNNFIWCKKQHLLLWEHY